MAIHYVDTAADAGGDGTTSDLTGAHCAWDTIADVNAHSFSAGDSILFKCGCTWREKLTVPSSGENGNNIVVGSYGTGDLPKIYGSIQVSTWTDEGSNVWYATQATDPIGVWFINPDTTIHWGKRQTLKASLDAEYEWWWDDPNDRLYVYAASDPDARYTSVEAGAQQYCIVFSAQTYITVQDIEAAFSKYSTVNVGSNCLVQRLTVHHNHVAGGLLGDGVILGNVSSSTISYNTIYECGRHGIFALANAAGTCSSNIIEHNTVYNCYHTCIDVMNTAGTASGNITRYNQLYNDATTYTDAALGCTGIYYSGESGYTQDDGQIYYNVSWNIHAVHINVGKYTTGTFVYNNSCYGTNPLNTTIISVGIELGGTGATTITAKNNIAMDIYSGAGGGDCCVYVNPAQMTACDYNCWYQSAGGTRIYGRDEGDPYHYNDFAAWQLATGLDAHSLWEDPKFVDAAGHDFHLLATSPCINTGVDVGLTEDFEGNPIE